MDRRTFIKVSGAAGATAFFPTPSEGANASKERPAASGLLQGVCDIHIHRETNQEVLKLAGEAHKQGYKALMLKPSVWPCHEAAQLANETYPGVRCFSGLIMNLAFGKQVNIEAARSALRAGNGVCRCIWMPTQQAAYPPTTEPGRIGPTISVADTTRRILPEVIRVMELCGEADAIFATGHSSPVESLEMARIAHEMGFQKLVVTHANSRIWRFTEDQVKQAVDLGAYMEYCYLPRLWGPGTVFAKMSRQSEEEFANYLRISPERSFISTDLGARGMPEPVDGMRMCVKELIASGIPQKTIDLLIRENPAKLLGIV